MNLETFKARARRKLALPGRNSTPVTPRAPDVRDTPAPDTASPARGADNAYGNISNSSSDEGASNPTTYSDRATRYQTDTKTAPEAPAPSVASAGTAQPAEAGSTEPSGADRFAAALDLAANTSGSQTNTAPLASDPRSDNFSANNSRLGVPLAGSSASNPPATTRLSSETELAHLRSLLLGNQPESQQDQVDTVYRRTQSGLNTLRQDMDARLSDLSDYVEQLEQSLLNSIENQKADLADGTAAMLTKHEQRLDALDGRLESIMENVLGSVRADLDTQRNKDRADLEAKLSAVTQRQDTTLNTISDRLDQSLAAMESSISSQLQSQSSTTSGAPEETISQLREQLSGFVDDRVNALTSERDTSLTQLRETVLMHSGSIKEELQAQTEQQNAQLALHRDEMEAQFNRAIMSLNDNKVSHRQLSQLLTRLADRVKQL